MKTSQISILPYVPAHTLYALNGSLKPKSLLKMLIGNIYPPKLIFDFVLDKVKLYFEEMGLYIGLHHLFIPN